MDVVDHSVQRTCEYALCMDKVLNSAEEKSHGN